MRQGKAGSYGGIGAVAALVVLALAPVPAAAQRNIDGAYVQGRLDQLQRSINDMSARLQQLDAQDRQLQQRMEQFQTRVGQRIERLEAGGGAKPVPRAATPPKRSKPAQRPKQKAKTAHDQ